jgi:hypothetical protein
LASSSRPRRAWRNAPTYAGGALSLFSLLVIVSLLFFDLLLPEPSPYIGLFTYLIFPALLTVGLLLTVAGLLHGRRMIRRLRGGDATDIEYYPHINFNLPSHRRAFAWTAGIAVAAIPFIGFMSYHGYEYTDSNDFCGAVCHTVMQPQYTAHKTGAHARVECAACHIGHGASWYVKSKLSGLRQVLAVATDSYDRPIPPAIHELRPARETCEQCHWPEKFYGDQLVTLHRFAGDQASSPEVVRMLVKTGGSDPTTGPPSGIHWHMALGQTIEFVAVDDALQEIPWVRAIDHQTRRTTVYRSDGLTSGDPVPTGTHRSMDCMDCHNRATHVFRPPASAADLALIVNPGLRELPFAKRQLVSAVSQVHDTREEALAGVETFLKAYYLADYPEVAASKAGLIDDLIETAREIVRVSYFPTMAVDWRTYPNNIGHKTFPGCFRCHEGNHRSDDGRTIARACESCHEFLVPTNPDDPESVIGPGGFNHPVALEGFHAELRCDLCHSGGLTQPATCEGCHADTVALRAGKLDVGLGVALAPEPMDGLLDCKGCHDIAQRADRAKIQATCVECHGAGPMEGMLATWQAKIDPLLEAAKAAAGPEQKAILARLRRAGPLHNPDATVAILSAMTAVTASR